MKVDPLAQTDVSGPATVLSLPPTAKPVALPAVRGAAADRPTRAWMLVVALLAGIATSLGIAYAMH